MTIAELTKRIAELKGWKVVHEETDRPDLCKVYNKDGKFCATGYGEDRVVASLIQPLSLLDEVEQAGCETDLWYFPKRIIREVPGYIARITTESYQCFTSVLCDTRDEAIYRAYIAYRESTKSGE